MQTIRTRLNNLSIQTKGILMNIYIYAISITILFAISLLYNFIGSQSVQNTSTRPQQQPYSKYVKQYAKSYSPLQQSYRRFIFYQANSQIIFHNKKQIDQNYVKGINEFSDLTKEEFQQLYLIVTSVATKNNFIEIADFQFDFYDWSEKYLNPTVKNMKGYDVGHVFATVELLQWWANRKRNQNDTWIAYSEQEVIDCCQNCGVGEQPHKVLKYMLENGISSSETYPYTSAIYNQAPQQCKLSPINPKPYQFKYSYERIKSCSELSLAIQKSPIIVGVDASTIKDYNYGIVQQCGTKRSHYMLLVGKGIGFWKLKNSWGPRWGERGYIRIKLGNTCAVCLHGYRVVFQE